MTKKKKFDCVKMKKEIQSQIYEEMKGMSEEEKSEYFKKAKMSGPLTKFWKSIQSPNATKRKASEQ